MLYLCKLLQYKRHWLKDKEDIIPAFILIVILAHNMEYILTFRKTHFTFNIRVNSHIIKFEGKNI